MRPRPRQRLPPPSELRSAPRPPVASFHPSPAETCFSSSIRVTCACGREPPFTFLFQVSLTVWSPRADSFSHGYTGLESPMSPLTTSASRITSRPLSRFTNASRGRQLKREAEESIPPELAPELCSREVKRNGSRLIRKVYETDPLVCPRCRNRMRVISSIEDPKVIRRFLEHLGLWLANVRPVPKSHSPPLQPVPFEALISQMPPGIYLSIYIPQHVG
jgi:hypothetical protein